MISRFLQIGFAVFALVLGAALEELLPKVLGVGVPVLLAVSVFMAVHRPISVAWAFAAVAGAVEDSLSSLSPMTSASFFLLAVSVVRQVRHPWLLVALVYPVYQIWLAMWLPGIGGGVFARLLLSCPIGFMASVAVDAAMSFVWRKAAVDEKG